MINKDPDLTHQCLEYIRKFAGMPYELIVVDNGANKELIKSLKKQDSIKIISLDEKPGIALGYNLGAKIAKCEHILFMQDYSLLTENCLHSMLCCLQDKETAGIVGPVSNGVSGHQHVPAPYKELHDLEAFVRINRKQNINQTQQTYRLLSHCLLIKKEVFEKIGGFDERFGQGGYEDDDLCLRAFHEGYSLYIALDAYVHFINPLSLLDFDSGSYFSLLRDNKQKAIDKWGFDIADYLLKLKFPISISLCMIVRNEEAVLARCLDCVKEIVDEIIIVDTGSNDRTKEIALLYTNKVFDFTWIDDFAAARNFSFTQASKDYILWLDADDVLLKDDQSKLLDLKNNFDPSIDAVTMNYNLAFDQYGNVTTSLRRNRLVKRKNNYQWIGAVHEYLAVYGISMDSDIAVTHKSEWHDSDRNLKIYEKRLAAGELFNPRDQYYYANELMDHQIYDKAIKWYQIFLESGQGWVEDNLSACRKLSDCFHQIGDMENAEKYIFKSFIYDTPRAEFCCRLGYYFLNKQQFKQAAFWYKLATELEKPIDSRGFMDHASWTWIPHLQLCVCYDRLGMYELAFQHNEMAAKFIPDDPNVLQNRVYLKNRLALK